MTEIFMSAENFQSRRNSRNSRNNLAASAEANAFELCREATVIRWMQIVLRGAFPLFPLFQRDNNNSSEFDMLLWRG
jgi:hypothetical protein